MRRLAPSQVTSLAPDSDDQPRLSELAIPIFFRDEVLGVLDSEHSQAGFFTEEHFHILTTVASMAAARVTRALLDQHRPHEDVVPDGAPRLNCRIDTRSARL